MRHTLHLKQSLNNFPISRMHIQPKNHKLLINKAMNNGLPYDTSIHYSTIISQMIMQVQEHGLPGGLAQLDDALPNISFEIWEIDAVSILQFELFEEMNSSI